MKKVFNATNSTNRNGWNVNTALAVDLKTMLRGDKRMKAGKDYQGVLRRDVDCEEFRYEEHYTFTETLPWLQKRNPRVFAGRYITITRRDDGTLRLNFRPLTAVTRRMTPDFYSFCVYAELRRALKGLVEKR